MRLLSASEAPWRDLLVLDSCGSTNAVLAADPRPWRVVTTDHQVSGRGRLARAWQTPPLAAVALSASIPLPAARVADASRLPLVAGLAVRAALADAGVATSLKWPNDVLVPAARPGDRDGKVCGILCEVAGPPGEQVVVVGIGINVDQSRAELPDLPGPLEATSMALHGVPGADRDALVAEVLLRLAEHHEAWAAGGVAAARLLTEYDQACLTIGRDVEVHLPGGVVERGRALRVDSDGRLVVEADGVERAHAAGDVVHARLAGGPG